MPMSTDRRVDDGVLLSCAPREVSLVPSFPIPWLLVPWSRVSRLLREDAISVRRRFGARAEQRDEKQRSLVPCRSSWCTCARTVCLSALLLSAPVSFLSFSFLLWRSLSLSLSDTFGLDGRRPQPDSPDRACRSHRSFFFVVVCCRLLCFA